MFIALTSSSSEDLEDAGRSGQEAACAHNEVPDANLKRRGFGGPGGRGGVVSSAVGCKPYCATWEIGASFDGHEYEPGGSGPSSPFGGPEGKGDVFSSAVGCFAPCYWEIGTPRHRYATPRELIGIGVEFNGLAGSFSNPGSRLRYYNDNRAPAVGEIRLGVTYKRTDNTDSDKETWESSDIYPNIRVVGGNPWTASQDGKLFYYVRTSGGRFIHGTMRFPGTPLTPLMIANGVPTVHTPNWRSARLPHHEELHTSWGFFNTDWEDEDWEVRADPEREVCEIVNTSLNDKLVCSSDKNSCLESNMADSTCPPGTIDPDTPSIDRAGTDACRIPSPEAGSRVSA